MRGLELAADAHDEGATVHIGLQIPRVPGASARASFVVETASGGVAVVGGCYGLTRALVDIDDPVGVLDAFLAGEYDEAVVTLRGEWERGK